MYLQFPEIRNKDQFKQLTVNKDMRQAKHIFLYFFTGQCKECYDQIDDINDAWTATINTYGIDSVIFYKVNPGLVDEKVGIHTYPTFLYFEPIDVINSHSNIEEYVPMRRLIGPEIEHNTLNRFVMECVENSSKVNIT